MVFPNTFAFSVSKITENSYVRYSNGDDAEVESSLRCDGKEVVTLFTKFVLVPSTTKGMEEYVNILCTYNNKYWQRAPSFSSSSSDTNWIVATAKKPVEEVSSPECTLFKTIDLSSEGASSGSGRICHALDGFYVRASVSEPRRLQAISTDPDDDLAIFHYMDWQSFLILPKKVVLKGDNGKYLSTKDLGGIKLLGFYSDDKGDKSTHHMCELNPQGKLIFMTVSENAIWSSMNGSRWIVVDLPVMCTTAVFQGYTNAANNKISLLLLDTNHFARRLSADDAPDSLNGLICNASHIIDEGNFQVEEPVYKREVNNTKFDTSRARIYGTIPFTAGTEIAINKGDQESSISLEFHYTDSWSRSWSNSVSVTTGFSISFQVGVPLVLEGDISISVEFNDTYQWGEERSHSEEKVYIYSTTVPPRSQKTVTMIASTAYCDVPFSYVQRDTSFDGKETYEEFHDGVYKGLNTVSVTFDESPAEPLPPSSVTNAI